MKTTTSKNLFDVTEKLIIITGGLGQLGRRYANSLISSGARVAVFDLVANKEGIVEKYFGSSVDQKRIACYPVDILDKESISSALEEVEYTWGTPYGLINNAAIDSPPGSPASENGPFEDYPATSWDKVIDVNLKGTFYCCQLIGAKMAEAELGSIINIGSIYGVVSPDQDVYAYRRKEGKPFYKPVAYSVSKSAILNLTRYLAVYWAKKGIRVNTLTLAGVFNDQDKEFLDSYCSRMPMGRMAKEDEYNGAIQFLMSDASSYMTGSNMVIDGGWTAK